MHDPDIKKRNLIFFFFCGSRRFFFSGIAMIPAHEQASNETKKRKKENEDSQILPWFETNKFLWHASQFSRRLNSISSSIRLTDEVTSPQPSWSSPLKFYQTCLIQGTISIRVAFRQVVAASSIYQAVYLGTCTLAVYRPAMTANPVFSSSSA